MAVELEAAIQDPHERPVELHGIRRKTYEAIRADVDDDQHVRSVYDRGRLELRTSVLYNIRWSTFVSILKDLGDHRNVRLSYDQGRLEFMSPTDRHETWKTLLGRMVEMLTFELRIPVRSGGSTTFKKKKLGKGVEPDECYWIAREPLVRGKSPINLKTDPAPDLVIEVDITHSSLPNLKIYAALGVPEVWRFENRTLWIYALQAGGCYTTRPNSAVLPGLAAADVERFVRLRDEMDETSCMYAFRDWIRAEFGTRSRGASPPTDAS
jgi:Uma2 family endonuclease